MNEVTKEDRLLMALAEDRKRAADERYMLTYTEFLDLRQQSMMKNEYRFDGQVTLYGGYEEAERKAAFFMPEYITDEPEVHFDKNEDDNPFCWLRIHTAKGSRKLSHRDYLGSLMALGIRREKTGDILVREDGADIVIMKDISEFLLMNYEKAGRTGLKVEIAERGEFKVPEPKYKIITDTVASLRLDSVLSSAFSISRAKAQEAIRRGTVFVNSAQIEKTDYMVNENDKLVIRGYGKAKLAEIGGKSRKDRTYIKIERYI